MVLSTSNTYREPVSAATITNGRSYHSSSLRALISAFYSTATPTSVNLTASGVNFTIPDGMLHFNKYQKTLYIANSANIKNYPIGGNFTRTGIVTRQENGIEALAANISTYEIGELVTTVSDDVTLKSNGALYLITDNSGTMAGVKDVGLLYDNAITTSMVASNTISQDRLDWQISFATGDMIMWDTETQRYANLGIGTANDLLYSNSTSLKFEWGTPLRYLTPSTGSMFLYTYAGDLTLPIGNPGEILTGITDAGIPTTGTNVAWKAPFEHFTSSNGDILVYSSANKEFEPINSKNYGNVLVTNAAGVVTWQKPFEDISFSQGDMLYYDGNKFIPLNATTGEYTLRMDADGNLPTWMNKQDSLPELVTSDSAMTGSNLVLGSNTDDCAYWFISVSNVSHQDGSSQNLQFSIQEEDGTWTAWEDISQQIPNTEQLTGLIRIALPRTDSDFCIVESILDNTVGVISSDSTTGGRWIESKFTTLYTFGAATTIKSFGFRFTGGTSIMDGAANWYKIRG